MKNFIAPLLSFNAKGHANKVSGFFLLCVLRGLQIVLGLVTTYFLVRTLSVEQYGEYQFILNSVGILVVFSLTELGNAVMQSVARGYEGSFRSALPYTFFCCFMGSIILLGMALWYGYGKGNWHLMAGLSLAAIIFPFMQGLTLWKHLKIGEENFSNYASLEIACLLIIHAGSIAMTFLVPGNMVGLLFFVMTIPAVLNVYLISKALVKISRDAPVEEGTILYGFKASLYTSFVIISNYADKLLLFFFLSPSALAFFVASDRVADLVRSVTQDVSVILAPQFAKAEKYSTSLHHGFKVYSLILGVMIVVFAFVFLPPVFLLIYGLKYADALPYAQALLCSVAIGNIASLQFRYIRSKLDTQNFRNITISTSVVRIVISLVLIPFFGILGAVISAFLYRIILSLTVAYVIRFKYLAFEGREGSKT